MTKDTIRQLSFSDLVQLIEHLELEVAENLLQEDIVNRKEDHENLINQIHEELEEIRRERHEGSSLPIQFQERRFMSIEDLFGDALDFDSGAFEFPEHYNVTNISLMLRDPEWAFAYWDISIHDRNKITGKIDSGNLYLILQECTSNEGARLRKDVLEIPIQVHDKSWYINIPKRDSSYTVVLVIKRIDGSQEVLAKSGEITVPLGALPNDFLNSHSEETDLMLVLSSIQNLGVSQYQQIPERILRHLDDQE